MKIRLQEILIIILSVIVIADLVSVAEAKETDRIKHVEVQYLCIGLTSWVKIITEDTKTGKVYIETHPNYAPDGGKILTCQEREQLSIIMKRGFGR